MIYQTLHRCGYVDSTHGLLSVSHFSTSFQAISLRKLWISTIVTTCSSGVSQPLRAKALWNCCGLGYSHFGGTAEPSGDGLRGIVDSVRSSGSEVVCDGAGDCESWGMLFKGFISSGLLVPWCIGHDAGGLPPEALATGGCPAGSEGAAGAGTDGALVL